MSQKVGYPDLISKSCRLNAEIAASFGNYKQAYNMLLLHKKMADSILTMETHKSIVKKLIQYEYENKEVLLKAEQVKKDAISNAEIEKQKTTQKALMGGSVSFMIISILVFSLYRSKNRLEKIKLTEKIKQQEVDLRNEFKDNLHDDLHSEIMAIKGNGEFIAIKGPELNKDVIIERIKKITESCEKILLNTEILIRENSSNADSADELFEDMMKHLEFSLPGIEIENKKPEVKTNLSIPLLIRKNYFLVFKECINNIKKHAECNKVIVSWGLNKNNLFLEIEDNGKGFDSSANFDGNGLESFKRRTEKMNGTIQIESKAGNGTKITLEAPLT